MSGEHGGCPTQSATRNTRRVDILVARGQSRAVNSTATAATERINIMDLPAAGWYLNPADAGITERYWDGAHWTDRTRPTAAAKLLNAGAQPPRHRAPRNWRQPLGWLAAGLIAAGALAMAVHFVGADTAPAAPASTPSVVVADTAHLVQSMQTICESLGDTYTPLGGGHDALDVPCDGDR